MESVEEFTEQLRKLGIDKSEMDILDVGCGKGWLFHALLINLKPGRYYDAVDTQDKIDTRIDRSRIRFFKESFTEFVPDKKYDLIFARNVFFHNPDQIQQALRYVEYLKDDGIMCVSFMGVDDPWADSVFDGNRYFSITETEYVHFKEQADVLWELKNTKFKNTARNGMEKDWHLYKMILKKK